MIKTPDPIDRHVGTRVRLRRMMLGISQTKLGEHCGITFQQIQKYEKGTNRISSSRLQHIARFLGVPVSWFFESAPGSEPVAGSAPDREDATGLTSEFLASAESIQLNRAFLDIRDPGIRGKIIELIRALAGDDELALIDPA